MRTTMIIDDGDDDEDVDEDENEDADEDADKGDNCSGVQAWPMRMLTKE